jgi:small-conductance mechanosensitive channel
MFLTKKTRWEIDDLVVNSLRGRTIIWFTLLGIYFGSTALSLTIVQRDILEKTFIVIAALAATSTIADLCKAMITTYFRNVFKVYANTSLVANVLMILVYIIGFLVVLQTLGLSIVPILTAFGVGGLAIALAMQDTLSNIFSGMHIVLSRKVRPGDFVELDTGEKGYVTDITWRNTTIRSLTNNMVIVPNSKMASVVITNYYQPVRETSLKIPVGVSYDSDLDHVEEVTIRVAKQVMKENDGAAENFEPFIRYYEFADFSINFKVILRVIEYIDTYKMRHAFIKKLHEEYKKEGIEIPFPIRTIYTKHQGKK